jgi:glucose/arabinose dehydrogenase
MGRSVLGLCSLILVAQDSSVRLERVAGGLTAPTDIQHAGDGSARLFAVEQGGRIRILREGALAPKPFLDISARTVADAEQGLLGLAFPPEFRRKQYFYVNYTDRAGDTVIARYRVTADPDVADPATETIVLKIEQPFANHNGRGLQFGPDGGLYIGLGDGGSGNDPMNYAQRADSLLGKMLRWDIEAGAAAPSIWARGLRNPWRFSFDRASGDLWIADVGQDEYEEVNFQPAASRGGENYGWRMFEGLHCANPPCEAAGPTPPVVEYTHNEGCSVTGGYVYRGRRYPGLRGMYFYGDYCSGRIWGLRREGERWVNRLLLTTRLNPSTFGEDEARELYLADHGGGVLYRIAGDPALVTAERPAVPGEIVYFYVTGLGPVENVPPTGAAAPRAPLSPLRGPVTLTLGGRPADILFAGLAPGLVGVYQINVRVPADASPGIVDLVVQIVVVR